LRCELGVSAHTSQHGVYPRDHLCAVVDGANVLLLRNHEATTHLAVDCVDVGLGVGLRDNGVHLVHGVTAEGVRHSVRSCVGGHLQLLPPMDGHLRRCAAAGSPPASSRSPRFSSSLSCCCPVPRLPAAGTGGRTVPTEHDANGLVGRLQGAPLWQRVSGSLFLCCGDPWCTGRPEFPRVDGRALSSLDPGSKASSVSSKGFPLAFRWPSPLRPSHVDTPVVPARATRIKVRACSSVLGKCGTCAPLMSKESSSAWGSMTLSVLLSHSRIRSAAVAVESGSNGSFSSVQDQARSRSAETLASQNAWARTSSIGKTPWNVEKTTMPSMTALVGLEDSG
ncbi:hypothetical protein HPB47_016724, partial [Ixodes persulcatus]